MLFEQIASNKKKTILFITLFTIFVLVIGACLTYVFLGDWLSGLVISAASLLFYIPYTIRGSTKKVMKRNRAVPLETVEDYPFLKEAVENMAMVARVPVPFLYLINDPSPNAFASGLTPENASIAVTTGLLETLNREEVEAVIAHEMAHIQNYDVRLMTIASAFVAIIAILSDIGSHVLFSQKGKDRHPVLLVGAIVLLALSPLVAWCMQMALSRNREFLADAQGAALCRNPLALASALDKITQNEEKPTRFSKSSAGMYIADPFKRHVQTALSTHPSPSERIERLKNM